ncbi:Ribokinase-like protein [Xylaria arbuscula]|nr:Ribokinase-like protein [Xylaria arbuscula]
MVDEAAPEYSTFFNLSTQSSIRDNMGNVPSEPETPPRPSPGRHRLLFCSLGPACIDDIHYEYPMMAHNIRYSALRVGIPGGAGLWATFGARVLGDWKDAADIGCFFAIGEGFPQLMLDEVRGWGVTCGFYNVPKECNRFFLKYGDSNFTKQIRQIAPRVELDLGKFKYTPFVGAKSFHIITHVKLVRLKVLLLDTYRRMSGHEGESRLIVWEPSHESFEPTEFSSYFEALKHVDVFSPNHDEICRLLERDCYKNGLFLRKVIEDAAQLFLDMGIGTKRDGAIVVRCAQHGCFYMDAKKRGWIAAYYSHGHHDVVDVTGAGSCFLGAFTVAYLKTGNLKKACSHGTRAASYAMEQYGFPELVKPKGPKDKADDDSGGHDKPNDDSDEDKRNDSSRKDKSPAGPSNQRSASIPIPTSTARPSNRSRLSELGIKKSTSSPGQMLTAGPSNRKPVSDLKGPNIIYSRTVTSTGPRIREPIAGLGNPVPVSAPSRLSTGGPSNQRPVSSSQNPKPIIAHGHSKLNFPKQPVPPRGQSETSFLTKMKNAIIKEYEPPKIKPRRKKPRDISYKDERTVTSRAREPTDDFLLRLLLAGRMEYKLPSRPSQPLFPGMTNPRPRTSVPLTDEQFDEERAKTILIRGKWFTHKDYLEYRRTGAITAP